MPSASPMKDGAMTPVAQACRVPGSTVRSRYQQRPAALPVGDAGQPGHGLREGALRVAAAVGASQQDAPHHGAVLPRQVPESTPARRPRGRAEAQLHTGQTGSAAVVPSMVAMPAASSVEPTAISAGSGRKCGSSW